ncbi:MAG: ribosome-associated translation inhibitor RaiA [Oscillospiraceae bacterium]|jgi:putative sigma-54 modulation protein|nr:ribosome-associated translation inhibitor RaiA [Oscillospiraceae bacterium]
MKFQYLGKQANISDKLKDYAEKKVGKLEKFFKNESEAQITVAGENNRQSVEITVRHDGMYFRAHESGDDRFAMIDKAVAAIERQIRKNKTRLEKSLHQGVLREAEFSAGDIAEEREFEIVRTKRFSLKPMTTEEAILQMNLLHHEFFVFRNIESGSFAVVYKRGRGGYGLIEEG